MGLHQKCKNIAKETYKLFDIKQPEVVWAATISFFFEALFLIIKVRENLFVLQDMISGLIECIIAGFFSLVGLAVAGIAIVIALFTSEQIKIMEKLRPGAFDSLLHDFKWFAFVSGLETAFFIALTFLINIPLPVAPPVVFYFLSFMFTYGVFYLLFYAYALIGNFIKMSKIKRTLDTAISQSKSLTAASTEIQLDYLISKLSHSDISVAQQFYAELINHIEHADLNNKDEIVAYLKKRYESIE